MTLAWLAGAAVIFGAHVVFGLAGFGVGLAAMAFLPYLMPPATAVVLLTVYAMIFAVVIVVPLRRDVTLRPLAGLIAGSIAGTPLGVWVLAVAPAALVNRLIGAMLVVVVALEFSGRLARGFTAPGWSVGAGVLSGVTGGAVGLPGPPVIVYMTTQPWSPRTFKANLQAYFIVNQGVILLGYWMAGLITAEVVRLTGAYLLPAAAGIVLGMSLFTRVDPVRFRRVVFMLLLVSGLVLLVGG
ncbi:MAG: sulfite exporter TauE/SafE family protein [Candidatus Rokubacteria bacterium]|nr:sulfite exporter TauE/SafE family protein [Candidatus Rokubacteria bacterium]